MLRHIKQTIGLLWLVRKQLFLGGLVLLAFGLMAIRVLVPVYASLFNPQIGSPVSTPPADTPFKPSKTAGPAPKPVAPIAVNKPAAGSSRPNAGTSSNPAQPPAPGTPPTSPPPSGGGGTPPPPSPPPPPPPPGPGGRSCPAFPAFPDASCTGVPPGTSLTPSGSFTITQDGTVVNALDVTGIIYVRAKNVTIQNTRVRGCGPGGAIDVGYDNANGPVTVKDVELNGQGCGDYAMIGNSNYTCIRCNIYGARVGAAMDTTVVVRDSWIHDLVYVTASHMEAILSNGGNNYQVIHNNLECVGGDDQGGCSAALAMFGDFGPIDNALVQYNLFNTSGSYCTYAGSAAGKPYPNGTNVRYLNNYFGKKYNPQCGLYGPATAWAFNAGNVWSDNVWADGSGTVAAPN